MRCPIVALIITSAEVGARTSPVELSSTVCRVIDLNRDPLLANCIKHVKTGVLNPHLGDVRLNEIAVTLIALLALRADEVV